MEQQQLILEPHQPHKPPMYQPQSQLDMLQLDTQQQDMPILDMQDQELDIDQSLKKSQSKAESNIFLLKLNTLNTIKSKKSKEFHTKDKLLNINKSEELFRSQLKELLLIIMQLKLKSNTFLKKLKRLLSNMNQSKELGKESNISQFKLKLFTTLREKNMLPALEDISKPLAILELLLLMLVTLELLALDTPADILLVDTLDQDQMLSTQQQSPQLEFIQQLYLLHHIKLIKQQQSQLLPHLPINTEVAEPISKALEPTMSIKLVKVLLLEPLEPEAIMVTHQEEI